ncbi:alpha/beta superfamily hydrolase-like protein [Rhexocercosporidium sp. MPI-PUGE-AT-0058]|nr:alpha/beta superfamily hydrolase-like protein [Rhexocercosporidium sp. MPI-PUGE-AT-0058]
MPGLPPNARRETIADYKTQLNGIDWREERTKSMDGTRISLCVAGVNNIDMCNASSIPPRLPFLSPVLRMLGDRSIYGVPVRYTMVCCSYRGYWTSEGRPSERGISMDAAASLDWIRDDFLQNGGNNANFIPIVIWGQSIGAGVATNLAAQVHLFRRSESEPCLSLQTLILETPFISVRAMLETLYPQRWLPYRHLWPFLWNHLDSLKALGLMKEGLVDLGMKSVKVILLEAGKDELVPMKHGETLEKRCRTVGLDVERKIIGEAYHTEVMVRPEGRLAVVEIVEAVSRHLFSQPRGNG